jgi:NAD-dependent DNA ligase
MCYGEIIWVQLEKANKLNVSIISEDDFMNLIQ